MRFLLTLSVGVVAGYVLHDKRDQTIEALGNQMANIVLGKRTENTNRKYASPFSETTV